MIGLSPVYNYPGDLDKWSSENTRFASNHGASLISRTLMKMFDADYVDDFSKVEEYRRQYELCVLAFATHITDWRDVKPYADFVEKLDIPTAAFSLGIQDYVKNAGNVRSVHPSMLRILRHVSNTTGLIGVRGFHTASLLYKEGFNNVVPVGCPTLFNPLSYDFRVERRSSYSRPLNVFHRTLSDVSAKLISGVPLLGQDFLDEAVFTERLAQDAKLVQSETNKYIRHKHGRVALENIKRNGEFVWDFDSWFDRIGQADFVFGARLHGCIAAIIQGIPAVMLARDIRVREIANFFKIPVLDYDEASDLSVDDLFERARYEEFNEVYPRRYRNFIAFLTECNILRYLTKAEEPRSFEFSFSDLQQDRVCTYQKIEDLNQRLALLERNAGIRAVSRVPRLVKRIPFVSRLWSR